MCDASRPESLVCPHKMESDYQVEVLKDDRDELTENNRLLQKELKSTRRERDQTKRDNGKLEEEKAVQKLHYEAKLKQMEEEKTSLSNETEQLREECETLKKLVEELKKARQEMASQQLPVADEVALARETNKQIREHHYKWKMAEQENSVMRTTISRLENQVTRYQESLKESETIEADLKTEKRKLLRELRESQAKVEELETNNSHLQKRLDRLRSRNLLTGNEGGTAACSMTPNSSLNNIPTSIGTVTTTTTSGVATATTSNTSIGNENSAVGKQ